MLLPTIAPIVSAINSSNAVPSTVIASASKVPSISALPEISRLAAVTIPTVILGVPLKFAAVPEVFWLPAVLTPGRSISAVPSKLTPPIVLAF